jgi:predicted acyl esterase
MFEPAPGAADSLVDTGLSGIKLSPHTVWEGPDPLVYCRNGFVVVNADARGSWMSEGTLTFHTRDEAEDGYDIVEWAARQEWSNGRVGMAGVSYLAWSQWNVAALQPPHLFAINPWEGYSDPYRDIAMHGGMRETKFRPVWIETAAFSRNRVEDVVEMTKRHPLIDEYWQARTPELENITVPLYAVVDWGDQGIHTRGTIEAFKRAGSTHKWLEVHGRLKWPYFYREESVRRQLEFFRRFLCHDEEAMQSRAPVNIEVRERYFEGAVRNEDEWPLARTNYVDLFLNSEELCLTPEPPVGGGAVEYDAAHGGSAKFRIEFAEDTELTGNMALHMWVESPEAEDIDLFVAIEKYDTNGDRVGFPFQSMFHDGPVALGWLRASHREIDETRSTKWQPWHPHTREMLLDPGEIVRVDIEIWPSSTLFRAGESLELCVAGREFYPYPDAPFVIAHEETRNRGIHRIHTGGSRNSHLTVPMVPQSGERDDGSD